MNAAGLIQQASSRYVALALSVLLAIVTPACKTLGSADAGMNSASADAEQQAAKIRALNEANATLQLKLLERNAELSRLNEERNEAVQEVVRTKSKLRGIESRAEAASTMAEVEIAMKQVKLAAAKAQQDPGPGIRKAEELLAMGAAEFEKSNYGGAIYLTTQAKGLIGTRREQMGTQNGSLQPDEVQFAFPIALESLKRSNVRGGPGRTFGVLLTLPTEAPLVGLSYKDEWVRVRLDDGDEGWIHYTLVGNQHSERR